MIVTSKANPLAYLKAIVVIIGGSLTGVVGLYGEQPWYVVAVALVTSIATYLTPNATVEPGNGKHAAG